MKMNYNGIVVVNAKNANFNADFDGLPRRLPNGTIFATDKALKYCIREYLAKNDPVFVQRTKEAETKADKDGKIKLRFLTLEDNYIQKCNGEIPKDERKILENLLKFIDVRLFGIVFAVDSNISLTGPCQIGYGINRYDKSNIYTSSILSPYRNPGEKSQESQQTTIGEQSRADDVYYVYDICLNMNSAKKQNISLSDEDIKKLKNALKYSVEEVTSTTKFGCETVSMLWFRNNGDKIFNNLNVLVDVIDDKKNISVDYSRVLEIIKNDVDLKTLEAYNSKVKNIIPK
jgi:CRISPR-associated protein Csh2